MPVTCSHAPRDRGNRNFAVYSPHEYTVNAVTWSSTAPTGTGRVARTGDESASRPQGPAGQIDDCVDSATRALGHDPVHPDARWILLLGQVRCEDLAATRATLTQGRRVRELLLTYADASSF